MKHYNIFFVLTFFLVVSCNKTATQQQTTALRDIVILKGEVHDVEYHFGDEIYLQKNDTAYVLAKYGSKTVLCQKNVEKNRVIIEFHPKEFKQYTITTSLGNSTNLLAFYPDADTIHFSITSSEPEGILISGGEYTNLYQSKMKNDLLPLHKEVEKIQEKYGISTMSYENGKEVITNEISHRKVDSVLKEYRLRELNKFPENPDITDYNLLYDNIWIPQSVDPSLIESIVNRKEYLDQKIKNPIYDSVGELILQNLQGFHSLSTGKAYRDISAQDLREKTVHLKNFVGNDEYLLLDFWATYCGPCIKKSKRNIPIYEEFKDKGLGIFSVMTDVENESMYKKLVEKYAYPWKVYSDINDKNHVRATYGFQTMGGLQLLLNKDGVIVLHNPTQEELRAFLDKNL